MIDDTRGNKKNDLRQIRKDTENSFEEDYGFEDERGMSRETKIIVGVEFVLASYYILALIDIVPMF